MCPDAVRPDPAGDHAPATGVPAGAVVAPDLGLEGDRDALFGLLQLMHGGSSPREFAREATRLLQEWSRCDAVGLRLRDGDDYPYCETRGFPGEFVACETSLCTHGASGEVLRDAAGQAVLECMCGNVIRGRFDPALSFFTAGGSFWTNSTTELLASTSEADRQARTRNRCNGEGYESVALVPLRRGDEALGLLQFNDRRKGRFTARAIAAFEQVAAGLAIALAERRSAQQARATEAAMRAVLDATDESVFVLDPAGTILMANATLERRRGLQPGEAAGRCIWDLLPADVAARRRPHVAQAFATGLPSRWEDEREGRRFEHTVFPVRDAGGAVTRVAVFGRDVTDTREQRNAARRAAGELAAIYAHAPVAMLVLDEDLIVRKANAHAARLTGRVERDLVGGPASRALGCADADAGERAGACDACALRRAVRETLATGRPSDQLEVQLPRAAGAGDGRGDGTAPVARWLTVSTARVDVEGLDRVLVCAQDITSRKLGEARLRDAERRYHAIFDHSPLWILLVRDGRYIHANAAAAAALGYASAREMQGLAIEATIAPSDRGRVRERAARVEAGGQNPPTAVRLLAADGTERVMEATSVPIELPHGPAILVMGQDVTARVEAERTARLQAMVLDQIGDQVCVTDLDGAITYVNDATCRGLRRSRDELVGARVEIFAGPGGGDAQREAAARTLADGAWRGTMVNVAADGTESIVDCRTQLVRDADGNPVAMCGIGTDVTESRRAEEALRQSQKMEAVGRLAAGIAHDFNNQLTVITGYAQLYLDDQPDGTPLRSALQEILGAGERARQTTNHLLAFSRKQVLEPRVLDVGELLEAMRNPVATLIGEDIRFVLRIPPAVARVRVDPTGLQQALMNLIVNARDAMAAGGDLAIEVEERDVGPGEASELEPGRYVAVTVRDSGCGMDAHTRERVFDPFFTTKPTGKGTGLGLPMVQGFVRQSRGAVGVRSAPGEGTSVRILLPAVPGEAAAVVPGREVPAAPAPGRQALGSHGGSLPGGSERVLVVEDDPGVRAMVVGCLRRAGYDVAEAGTPAEALVLASAPGPGPDLVLSDMVMPQMNGAELARRIRALRPAVRTLFMSGYVDQRVRAEVGALLHKPFGPAELAARVRAALDA